MQLHKEEHKACGFDEEFKLVKGQRFL